MEDEVLQLAYDKAEQILLKIKNSEKAITGISQIEPDWRYNYLTVDILKKYDLVSHSTPDFANSIITINKKGIEAINSGLKLWIEEQDRKQKVKEELEERQLWAAKYWWIIVIITAGISSALTWLLTGSSAQHP